MQRVANIPVVVAFNVFPKRGHLHSIKRAKCQRGYGVLAILKSGESHMREWVTSDAYKRVKAERSGRVSGIMRIATNSANSILKRRREFFESYSQGVVAYPSAYRICFAVLCYHIFYILKKLQLFVRLHMKKSCLQLFARDLLKIFSRKV